MRMRFGTATGIFAILALYGCGPSTTPASMDKTQPAESTARAAVLHGSYRFERNGWIFTHLEGTPDRIGFQHGFLLAREIDDLLRVTRPFLRQTTKKDWAFYRETAQKMLWPGIDEEYRAELDGIVAGLAAKGVTAVDRWDIVALNAIEELPGYYTAWLEKQQGKTPTTHAPGNCSAFIATGDWTKDRRIVFGHNAWTTYITGERWNIIFDIKPSRGHHFIMDGLPGIIASDDDFGINVAGIMITETTITQFEGFNPAGTPEFYRARKAMQYAESIDDYVRIMVDRNNGGYANDWLLGDNKTGEMALFELGLKNWTVDKTKNGYFVGSNFPVKAKLMKEETTFDPKKKDSSPNARRTRWEQLMAQHKGAIDAELGKAFEADKYDAIEKKDGPTERSLCGAVEDSPRGVPEWDWGPFYPGGTTQAKVADATMAGKLQLWAAMGRPCASDFKADAFLAKRPQYGWMKGLLRDMKSEPWTVFTAGMTAGETR
ncbi:MAG: C45 family peptidase [Acidobacteriota bacterium]